MRQSPRRPLILKRRKLPFLKREAEVPRDEPDGLQCKAAPVAPGERHLPDTICIVDHPSLPDTQVVVIPKTADLQSIIDTLSAKGKECGTQGPNKFILLSGGSGSLEDWPSSLCLPLLGEDSNERAFGNPLNFDTRPEGGARTDYPVDTMPLTTTKSLNKELDCNLLDDSLTNIQWLGGMCSDGLGSDAGRKASNKENRESYTQHLQTPQHLDGAQRPPYSYMAMIQFAINSKLNRKMTLKEIYTWIEDHFPYFRNVAKPGWKNSIRHNLSLHDMFIRETSQDGKISFWTIRPEANRCLTLDQVYKPVPDPTAPPSTQVCEQQQLKPAVPQLRRPTATISSERKMKPLLPRTDSYLVPIQLSLNPSLFLHPAQRPLVASQHTFSSVGATDFQGGGKRVRIAPKCALPPPVEELKVEFKEELKEELKEEPLCVSLTCEAPAAPHHHPQRGASGSRRKQCLAPPSREEPVLLFPDSTFFDSGLTSDLSVTQDMRDTEPSSPGRVYAFKTPIKGSRPTSSTPSKPLVGEATVTLPQPWRTTPQGVEGRDVLDFSPIRTPLGTTLTPQHHSHDPFNTTPFREPPLFSSPRELLTSTRCSPGTDHPRPCSRELQIGGSALANRSLTEGLVLDAMNDSLSKILVDISFSGLEDEELDVCNISWSQFIPEFK
ncbi:hypothetical protein AAFF_G00083220 [Aldrovandia affinis]|uniref:Forkhead box protein M1 n=1 Tax=Aldrovandia affinis TaxID=143900 RepID=A0AAD7RXA1_9TELE|nr:hypothetical protein AAFF_G00083220 [Aldrovandia affinis]